MCFTPVISIPLFLAPTVHTTVVAEMMACIAAVSVFGVAYWVLDPLHTHLSLVSWETILPSPSPIMTAILQPSMKHLYVQTQKRSPACKQQQVDF